MRVGKEPQAVLVLDCGATNVRAICISAEGRILAARSVPNAASPDPGFPTGMIWDHERIWRDFSNCARSVVAEVGAERIGALTVTTFGVDGTLVGKDGAPLYPVISWRCQRTASIPTEVEALLPDLYQRALNQRSFTAARYWGQGLIHLQREGRLVWTALTGTLALAILRAGAFIGLAAGASDGRVGGFLRRLIDIGLAVPRIVVLLVLPYIGTVLGARKGEWRRSILSWRSWFSISRPVMPPTRMARLWGYEYRGQTVFAPAWHTRVRCSKWLQHAGVGWETLGFS